MTKVAFTKVSGILAPFGPDAEQWMQSLKAGQYIEVNATRPRNSKFHAKYFALLNYGFENWDVDETKAAKNFDRFRDDMTILAGYYEQVWRADGTFRIEPKSISFAKMEADEFERLYSKTLDVLLAKIIPTHTTEQVNKILAFC